MSQRDDRTTIGSNNHYTSEIAHGLHLTNLSIQSFRGIKHLQLPKLNRVTLLTGVNSIGKTSVLDAVRIWAARGRPFALLDILSTREEVTMTQSSDQENPFVCHWGSLFHSDSHPVDFPSASSICIGPTNQEDQVRITNAFLKEDQAKSLDPFERSDFLMSDGRIMASQVIFGDETFLIPWTTSAGTFERNNYRSTKGRLAPGRILWALNQKEWPEQITCSSLGPNTVNTRRLGTSWDRIALTEYEDLAVKALNLVLGDSSVERVALLGDYSFGRSARRFFAKVKGQYTPVPLKRFGEGAVRLFGMALTLANCKNSMLLIDEVENGIHHSIQYDLWKMILTTANVNNTQVIATTHSWDCVKGFAEAAMDDEKVEGSCVRLERDNDTLYSVEYTESELDEVVSHGIEVR